MIVLVAAMGRNRVIGVDGDLPWHLPEDLARFKRLTTGKPVVMGRATFESIGRPLPNRTNIVISRNPAFSPDGVHVVGTPGEALLLGLRASDDMEVPEVAIIGGGQIYRQFLPMASRIELTIVDREPAGDTTFPELGDEWVVTHEEPGSDDPTLVFQTLRRRTEERTHT